MLFTPSIVAFAAALFSANVVQGHMKMATPYPYGPDTLNNSPLDASGSDFPCKQRPGVYAPAKQANTYAVGGTGELSFIGSAVHGGGSCQISLTTDKQPTKNSAWKVILSIEGGCPANTDGNLPANPNGNGAATFKFTIPESIAPGDYTLAWTWFNRIGNREMYMNCAPVTITASKKRYAPSGLGNPLAHVSLAKRDDLPAMFTANIGNCITKEGIDIRFPDPGNNVQYNGNPKNLLAVGQPVCTPTNGGQGPVAGGGGSSGGSSGGSGGSAPAPSASSQASAPSSATVQPGVFATASASASTAPAPAPSSAAPQPSASPAPAPAPEPSPSQGGSTSGGSGGSHMSGACTDEGAWNCIGGSQWQRCASGQWSAVQPVAAGTTCTVGISADLKIAAVAPLRMRSGIHRRRGNHQF